MSYNGSGTFLINTAGQPVVSGTVISSTAFNALTADLATGLSTAITKDGQTTVTANIPMGTYKFTGLGAGTAATDSANLSQVQSTVTKLLASVSGADTITAVGSPTLGAYAAGQMFYFVAASANTGAVTINIDSLGAKSITRDGTTALAAGDIQSGEVCVIVYDGTQFQLVNGASQSASIVTENLTVNKATVLNESGGNNDTRIEGDTDANLFFADASTDRIGVGTSSPGYKLTVAASDSTAGYFTSTGAVTTVDIDNTNANGWGGNLAIRTGGTAAGYFGTIGSLLGTTTQDLAVYATAGNGFRVYTNGNNLRATFDSSGNLGLGTTSPTAKLHVWQTGAATSLNIDGTENPIFAARYAANADGATIFLAKSRNATVGSHTIVQNGDEIGVIKARGSDGTNFDDAASITFAVDGTPSSGSDMPGRIVFGTSADGTASITERARITSGGDFLVNTTGSGGKFTLNGNICINTGGYNSSINTGITINAGGYANTTAKATAVHVGGVGDNNNRCGWMAYSIKTNGANHGAEYYLRPVIYNGSAFAEQGSSGVYLTDNATSWTSASDERIKEIIEPITNAANKVASLRAVIGRYKTDEDGTRRSFLIAQDVQAVLPEAVKAQEDEQGTLGLAYTETIPLLVAAIKELKSELDVAKAEIAALKGA